MGCSTTNVAIHLDESRPCFQYPQSGSMGCSQVIHKISTDCGRTFQYPQSGSMGCSGLVDVLNRNLGNSFSIPKADRWAAAHRRRGVVVAVPRLSVSPKRIDGLQLVGHRGCASRVASDFQYPQSGSMGCSTLLLLKIWSMMYCFQYPQSGSMGCSFVWHPYQQVRHPSFSIPKADRWAAAGVGAGDGVSNVSNLSVSPKRIDGLQPTISRSSRVWQ